MTPSVNATMPCLTVAKISSGWTRLPHWKPWRQHGRPEIPGGRQAGHPVLWRVPSRSGPRQFLGTVQSRAQRSLQADYLLCRCFTSSATSLKRVLGGLDATAHSSYFTLEAQGACGHTLSKLELGTKLGFQATANSSTTCGTLKYKMRQHGRKIR